MAIVLVVASAIAAPPNNNFSSRIAIGTAPASVNGTNVDASLESGEPDPLGIGGASVWWQFNAPSAGWYRIDTVGGSFDTVLYVFTGTSLGSLTAVATNDDDHGGTTKSRVNVFVSSNVKIAVHGYEGVTGSIKLNIASISIPPGNDNFSGQINLGTVSSVSTAGNNSGATLEGPEPDSLDFGGASLWWRWTAPSNGFFEIDTFGSNFDTVLYVFTGSAVDSLTEIKSNDDDNGDEETSRVVFQASSGQIYCIAVHGFEGEAGSISLNIDGVSAPPANDNFAGRTNLGTTASVGVSGNNAGASFEGFEQDSLDSGGASVWWRWVAPTSATYRIDTFGSGIDTVLYVFTGPDLANLTEEAANDDASGSTVQSRVNLAAASSQVYYIAVHGFFGETGSISLNIVSTTPPSNNNYSSRINLGTVSSVNTTGHNVGASLETGEPDPLESAGSSVWWEWRPTVDGWYQIETLGSDFDTVLIAFTGSILPNLVMADANDDDSAAVDTSRLVFFALSSQSYKIAVHGFDGDEGTIALHINPVAAPPANDDFSGATALAGAMVANSAGNNLGATLEGNEADSLASGGKSVWFAWTAPASGTVAISTFGSDFDTVLYVFSGATPETIVEVASNDDANGTVRSKVTFAATPSETYRIAVHGFEGEEGTIQLQVSMKSPYQTWLARFPSLTGANALPLANSDRDPYSNLLELVLGLDPTLNSSTDGIDPKAANRIQLFTGPGSIELRFRLDEININAGVGTPISVMGGVSTNVQNWTPLPPFSLGGDLYKVGILIDGVSNKFLDLRAIDTNP